MNQNDFYQTCVLVYKVLEHKYPSNCTTCSPWIKRIWIRTDSDTPELAMSMDSFRWRAAMDFDCITAGIRKLSRHSRKVIGNESSLPSLFIYEDSAGVCFLFFFWTDFHQNFPKILQGIGGLSRMSSNYIKKSRESIKRERKFWHKWMDHT